MPSMDDPRASKAASEPVGDTSTTHPVSRGWVIVGSLAILVGAVLGLIMSSLGR